MLSPYSALYPAAGATDITQIPGLRQLWAQTMGDPRICVAVLDGPIDSTHPSFAGMELSELTTHVQGRTTQGLTTIHGTHIASVIFGRHDEPTKGIAPGCRGLIAPIFGDAPDGSFTGCSQRDLALAITKAAHAGAHIINISGGVLVPNDTDEADPHLTNAVRYCAANRVLIVAAAGNEGCDCLHVPGALPSVLAVGAMSSQGLPLNTSNWGEKYQTQGVLAPGENIPGAAPTRGSITGSGTSYATPIVSGVAALLLSLLLKQGQKPDPQQVRDAILSSALGCDDKEALECRYLLVGRLDVRGAMSRIINGENVMSNSIEPETNVNSFTHGEVKGVASDVELQTSSGGAAGSVGSGADAAVTITQPMVPGDTRKNAWGRDDMNQYRGDPVSLSTATCGCSCGDNRPVQLVFPLGKLGYDFVTQDRFNSIKQSMIMHRMRKGVSSGSDPDPNDPSQFLEYLEDNPSDAAAVCWTLLNLEDKPIYAIKPKGAFASETYQRLLGFLEKQTSGEIERVSISGCMAGSVGLSTCITVNVICPVLRGMYAWSTDTLAKVLLPEDKQAQAREDLKEFLNYLYEEKPNLGILPEDRALNFAATNAWAFAYVFEKAQQLGLEFDTFHVEHSQSFFQDADRLDIKLLFFNPEENFKITRQFLFAVGVGDEVPSTLDEVREPFISKCIPKKKASKKKASNQTTQ